jgi:hypothetical protein
LQKEIMSQDKQTEHFYSEAKAVMEPFTGAAPPPLRLCVCVCVRARGVADGDGALDRQDRGARGTSFFQCPF